MVINVLGGGCRNCARLFAEVEKAIVESGVEASLVKIEKLDEIMGFDVMRTPALVIDGRVVCSGRVAKSKEIVTWIKERCAGDGADA